MAKKNEAQKKGLTALLTDQADKPDATPVQTTKPTEPQAAEAEKMVQLTAWIPESLHMKAKMKALTDKTTLKEVLAEALRTYIS